MTTPFLPMESLLIHGDVQAVLIRYLRSRPETTGISFGTDTPANLDQRLPFCTLDKLPGGERTKVMDFARIDVEVRGTTREQSQDAMQVILALLEVAYPHEHEGMTIYRIDVPSPGWLPDPITNQPRWIATVGIQNRPK